MGHGICNFDGIHEDSHSALSTTISRIKRMNHMFPVSAQPGPLCLGLTLIRGLRLERRIVEFLGAHLLLF
jgi:uncharacterized SAM-dependent methyltransferase